MPIKQELAAIGERLLSVQQIFEQYVKAQAEQWSRQKQGEDIPTHVAGTFRLPEAIEAQRTANQNRYHTTQKLIAVAAWAAFVAALLYAVVARLQLNEMRTQTAEIFRQYEVENADASHKAVQWLQQLKIAQQQAQAAQDSVQAIKRQMRQDQRSWIKIEMKESPKLIVNKNPFATIVVTNIGKTAARNITIEVVVHPWKRDIPPALTFENGVPRRRATVGVLYPQEPFPIEAKVMEAKPSSTSKIEYPVPSLENLKDWEDGTFYLLVYARTRYFDIFDVYHTTTFCSIFSGNTTEILVPTIECAKYNAVDNN